MQGSTQAALRGDTGIGGGRYGLRRIKPHHSVRAAILGAVWKHVCIAGLTLVQQVVCLRVSAAGDSCDGRAGSSCGELRG